jgi:hypothetical protein
MTYKEFLIQEGYRDIRFINDGREWLAINPYIFTHAIIKGTTGHINTFDDRWCYDNYEAAKRALDAWDGIGEPNGWKRHPGSGRRRPDGNATKEYINF